MTTRNTKQMATLAMTIPILLILAAVALVLHFSQPEAPVVTSFVHVPSRISPDMTEEVCATVTAAHTVRVVSFEPSFGRMSDVYTQRGTEYCGSYKAPTLSYQRHVHIALLVDGHKRNSTTIEMYPPYERSF